MTRQIFRIVLAVALEVSLAHPSYGIGIESSSWAPAPDGIVAIGPISSDEIYKQVRKQSSDIVACLPSKLRNRKPCRIGLRFSIDSFGSTRKFSVTFPTLPGKVRSCLKRIVSSLKFESQTSSQRTDVDYPFDANVEDAKRKGK